MPAKPDTCPTCGAPKCWEQGASTGYIHNDGCPALIEGIPVRVQVGDGELTEIGRFSLEGEETLAESLINFLHATSMLMLSKTGRNPAANCMEPAMKVSRANN